MGGYGTPGGAGDGLVAEGVGGCRSPVTLLALASIRMAVAPWIA